jgi:hypothetical protein
MQLGRCEEPLRKYLRTLIRRRTRHDEAAGKKCQRINRARISRKTELCALCSPDSIKDMPRLAGSGPRHNR